MILASFKQIQIGSTEDFHRLSIIWDPNRAQHPRELGVGEHGTQWALSMTPSMVRWTMTVDDSWWFDANADDIIWYPESRMNKPWTNLDKHGIFGELSSPTAGVITSASERSPASWLHPSLWIWGESAWNNQQTTNQFNQFGLSQASKFHLSSWISLIDHWLVPFWYPFGLGLTRIVSNLLVFQAAMDQPWLHPMSQHLGMLYALPLQGQGFRMPIRCRSRGCLAVKGSGDAKKMATFMGNMMGKSWNLGVV